MPKFINTGSENITSTAIITTSAPHAGDPSLSPAPSSPRTPYTTITTTTTTATPTITTRNTLVSTRKPKEKVSILLICHSVGSV